MKRRERKPLKKLTAMFLALALIFSLTACAGGTAKITAEETMRERMRGPAVQRITVRARIR